MFSFEYDFFPILTNMDLDDYVKVEIVWFFSALYKNGQILNQNINIVMKDTYLRCYGITLEEDSLSRKNYNKYCSDFLNDIINKSIKPPEYRIIGKTIGETDLCTCQNSSSYILFSLSSYDLPPITCLDCNLPIPLYKFPKINEEDEYYTITHWEKQYISCDSLFMSCDVGEKYSYKQISKHNSKLSEQGIDICRRMTSAIGKPFYYFLYKYYGKNINTCPMCGSEWKLEEELHNFYGYKCDKCNLISNEHK